MISGNRGASLIAAAVGLAVVGAIAGAGPSASAAPGLVEVSPDGVTYSANFSGALFDSIGLLVPGDSMEETLFVRNSGTESGYLRITLRDVVAADADFADALTVSASTASQPGVAAAISGADPCLVLTEGQLIAPGQSVMITTELMLGDLTGQDGQGATASLGMRIALSSAAARLPATDCGNVGANIVVVPQQRPVAGPVTPAIPVQSGSAFVAVPPGATVPDLPVLGLPGILGMDPNTWRLFEEYLVLVLIAAFIIGTAWFAFVAWRRRKNEADQEEMESIQ